MRLATPADAAYVEACVMNPLNRTWIVNCVNPDDTMKLAASVYLTPPSFSVVGEEGCFLAHCIGPGRHVVHTNLLPGCRGTSALRAAIEAKRIAFLETDCVELVSVVPGYMPHALWFAKMMGMKVQFERKAVWEMMDKRWDLTFVGMTIDDWVLSGECKEKGQWFHDKLGETNHREDPVHDCYVGTAVQMIAAGNVHKAIAIYNRWAAFALYEQIAVLSEHPLRIDIGSHVLRVEEGDFNVEATCLSP